MERNGISVILQARGLFPPDKHASDVQEQNWGPMFEHYSHLQELLRERREGRASLRIVQNVYKIRRWAFVLPNLVWGVYHSGIDIEGLGEYSFDSTGIRCQTYDEVRDIPELRFAGGKPSAVLSNLNTIEAIIEDMQKEYSPGTYHYLEKNCHHFCDDLARRIGIKPLHEKFKQAPQLLLDWQKPFWESKPKKVIAAVVSFVATTSAVAAIVSTSHRS